VRAYPVLVAAPPVRKKKRFSGSEGAKPSKSKRYSEHTSKSLQTDGFPDGVELMTSRQVADVLVLDIRVLADWRYRNRCLPYYSLGRMVRYRESDIVAFLENNLNKDSKTPVTERERESVRKHLSRVIDLIRSEGISDLAAFVIQGGGFSYGVMTETMNGRIPKRYVQDS